MPLYTFKCPECGVTQDVQLPIDLREKAAVWCPKSWDRPGHGPLMMDRQLTAANFTIEGFNAKNGYSK